MKRFDIFKRYLGQQIYTAKEENEWVTYSEIKEGLIFKGYNLWILGFAMIIACIGLTTNSVSAVIGAMLISPLMGPVIGFAFGLAINDRNLKIEGIRNWVKMTVVSFASATLFFLVNPFDHSTQLLESFQKASIFDIFLAFFGGLAGFIGIVKREGMKIIAGVAIATACMPPICTAAYGIAHLDFTYFIGGFYFYLINCLFIGWATFLLSRYFKFETVSREKRTMKNVILWDLLLIVMLIPGIWIGYQKWKIEEDSPPQMTDSEKIRALEKRIESLERNVSKN
ncbi:DUF389 domain-containing protein [Chryseobacterium profundimaris]|uniref:Uncharacterized hydrophobic domain-containing protein n=1 Tax=Chryseobacterium profundimaris TaxID=1387275 RepID=A0ABY1NLQ5_9FLAO|nr:DUF389 domain-containing protein [Chryseobacterium profundimaris]SMP13112.1 uncharacterized hydrophobic domain-containing protein [Chryseobacterium profundimaris]